MMSSATAELRRPKLRSALDVQPLRHDGQECLVFRDPLELREGSCVLPQSCAPILARFDGTRTVASIVEEGAPWGVSFELVMQLVQILEEQSLLEGPDFEARLQEVREEFQAQTLRRAVFGDLIYPRNPVELEKKIIEFQAGIDIQLDEREKTRVVSIAAPHIDYQRGWKTYGVGASLLRTVPQADVIVLLGTSHSPGVEKFILLNKGFETPFGELPVAAEVVESIAGRYGRERAFREQLLHRREHSLELQAPFLAWRYRRVPRPRIVPLLVGSFYEEVRAGKEPVENGEIVDFIGALSEVLKTLRQAGQRVLFYAGIDLAHVGRHFGDRENVSDRHLGEIENRDRALLRAALGGSESELFAHIAEDGDRRRICGFPSLYTMLATKKQMGIAAKGKLLEYRQSVTTETDCVVTFASAYWTE